MAKYSSSQKLAPEERESLLLHFFKAFGAIKSPTEAADILTDLLSEQEIEMLAKRLAVAQALLADQSYQEISRDYKVSPQTIARISLWLSKAGGGIRVIIQRIGDIHTRAVKQQYKPEKGSLHAFKRRHAVYFWPELLFESLTSEFSRSEKKKIQTLLMKVKQKSAQKYEVQRYMKSLLQKV